MFSREMDKLKNYLFRLKKILIEFHMTLNINLFSDFSIVDFTNGFKDLNVRRIEIMDGEEINPRHFLAMHSTF